MTRTTRSKNLDLIRWLNFGHENTAKKLISLTNANYLSKMATGNMEISEHNARSIESVLKLPSGWLDRDNLALINMTTVDSDIYQATKALSDASKTALLAFVRTLKTKA
jgi:hypothetical protein